MLCDEKSESGKVFRKFLSSREWISIDGEKLINKISGDILWDIENLLRRLYFVGQKELEWDEQEERLWKP